MARCALILLALGCIFAAVAAQAPAVAPDLIITSKQKILNKLKTL
jgi:hypothetical protein